jgi:hypothetical protein
MELFKNMIQMQIQLVRIAAGKKGGLLENGHIRNGHI